MKRIFLIVAILAMASFTAMSQKVENQKSATDEDKIAVFDADGNIARGAAIGDSKIVSIEEVFANPADYAGMLVRIDGYVVRSCKMQGCWAEIGSEKDATRTVRVTMKDHGFFIPLKSAGFKALAEGVFEVKTLTKEKVMHLTKEDGATFDKIDPDGTVTEVAFVANGIVLTKE